MCGPRGLSLRPTSDKVREALFSILGDRVPGRVLLDLYAGSGAVGIEALSRGAARVTFVEAAPSAVRLLRRNLDQCGLTDRADIHSCPVEQFLRRSDAWKLGPFDVIFADPPYAAAEETAALLQAADPRWVAPHGIVVLEHAAKRLPPETLVGCPFARRYHYGDTALSLFTSREAPRHS